MSLSKLAFGGRELVLARRGLLGAAAQARAAERLAAAEVRLLAVQLAVQLAVHLAVQLAVQLAVVRLGPARVDRYLDNRLEKKAF